MDNLYEVIAYDKDNDISKTLFSSSDYNTAVRTAKLFGNFVRNDSLLDFDSKSREPFDWVYVEYDNQTVWASYNV